MTTNQDLDYCGSCGRRAFSDLTMEYPSGGRYGCCLRNVDCLESMCKSGARPVADFMGRFSDGSEFMITMAAEYHTDREPVSLA